jgi:uncharacterized protein YdeI (YjbR/CyaY-like superfamily)
VPAGEAPPNSEAGARPSPFRRQPEIQLVQVESRSEVSAWLEANHATAQSVWFAVWKKPDPRHLALDEIIEEALCHGWSEIRSGKLDATRTMLLIGRRADGAYWSRLDKERIERLVSGGRMQSRGQTRIDAARADGSWEKPDPVEALEVPDDLAVALAALPAARANWDTFPKSARRGILEWIEQSRFPKTRAARIKVTAADAALNKRVTQWRGTPRST